MQSLNALLRRRPLTVDPLELRRLVASVRRRVLSRPEETSVGRYALVGKLGEGGFGVVYRAYDPRTRRHVALKVLRPDLGRRTPRGLRNEARALAAVQSERVVRVLDFGRSEEREFFVMQLLEGTSLRRWNPRDVAEALSVLDDIVAGVEAIHAQRLLHCDLKPENIVVDDEGRAVIVDFGLAVRVDGEGQHERRLGGTPPYCAPEQLRGGPIDLRVDQYSLGTIGLELMQRVPEHPSDGRIATALRRAASLVPKERFASVTELRRALEPKKKRIHGVVGLAIAVAALGVFGVRHQAAEVPEDPVTVKPVQAPRDPLRIRLDKAYALYESEQREQARGVLEAIPPEVWRAGDPSGQADGLSIRAGLAFDTGDDARGLELLEAAVWTALDGNRDQTVALHATELAAQIARCTGDAAASERMSSLAWAAIVRDGSRPSLMARYWSTRAVVERFLGRPDRELEAAKRALATLETTPDGASWREHADLAFALRANSEPELARASLERAMTAAEGNPQAQSMIAPALAEIEYELGDVESAIRIARTAVERSADLRGAGHPITINARASLGLMLIEHDPEEAVRQLRTNVHAYEDDASLLAHISRANMARAMVAAGDVDEGERLLAHSIASLESEGTSPKSDLAYLYGMLGDVQTIAGRPQDARATYAHAIARLEGEDYADELRDDLQARQDALQAQQAQDVADDRYSSVGIGEVRQTKKTTASMRPPRIGDVPASE